MKNPAPYIRTQLFTLLESVPYGSKTVSVFEQGNADDGLTYYIEIGEMYGTPDNDKRGYQSAYTQVVEVVEESEEYTRRHIDEIGEVIMERIKPTRATCGLPNSEGWQITNLEITPPRYLKDEGASGSKINRLLLELKFDITQRN